MRIWFKKACFANKYTEYLILQQCICTLETTLRTEKSEISTEICSARDFAVLYNFAS